MQRLDFPHAEVMLLDGNIVLVEPGPGAMIDRPYARQFYDRLERLVDGPYRLIVNRTHRYQLFRVEVFNVINDRDRLQGLAVVASKDSARRMAELEGPLCRKPFGTFATVDEAAAWLTDLP